MQAWFLRIDALEQLTVTQRDDINALQAEVNDLEAAVVGNVNLSLLLINTDKDWLGYDITNVGNIDCNTLTTTALQVNGGAQITGALDVLGNLYPSGTVDGVDIAALNNDHNAKLNQSVKTTDKPSFAGMNISGIEAFDANRNLNIRNSLTYQGNGTDILGLAFGVPPNIPGSVRIGSISKQMVFFLDTGNTQTGEIFEIIRNSGSYSGAYEAMLTLNDAGLNVRLGSLKVGNVDVINSSGVVVAPKNTMFEALQSAVQSLTAGSFVKIAWGSEGYDPNAVFSGSTFTAPYSGKYLINAQVAVNNVAANKNLQMVIASNANANYPTEGYALIVMNCYTTGVTSIPMINATKLVNLTAGTTLEVFVKNNDSVARDTRPYSGETFFAAYYLGS